MSSIEQGTSEARFTRDPRGAVEQPAAPSRGLKSNAIGLFSSVAIGVAATTPGVSVAIVFGLLAFGVGVHIPAAVLLGFLPILCVTSAYYHLNKADPDCGTVFSWATKAFGPWVGWFGGWIVVAGLAVIVTNYAQLMGGYMFQLFYWESAAASTAAVTALGVALFVVISLIAYRGIELSRRVQMPLLAFEIGIFLVFAVFAIVKAGVDDPAGSVTPALSWFDPTGVSSGALLAAFAAAALLYWGWDTTVMVNEESEHRRRNPGLAATISVVVLLGFYVICAIGLLAWAGPDRLAESGDVIDLTRTEIFGDPADHLMIFAVLTSALAGCLFLPVGGSRTLLSMAREKALPQAMSAIHPKFQTPTIATIVFSVISIVYFVVMTIVSDSVLVDSLTALGLLVALYYALVGLCCVVYFRKRWVKGGRDLLMLCALPLIGAGALIAAVIKNGLEYAKPEASAAGTEWFGLGAPFVIAVVIILLGVIGALVTRRFSPEFFDRKPQAAPAVESAPVPAG